MRSSRATIIRSIGILLVLGASVLGACGKANKEAVFTPEVGHPEGWVADHGGEYREAAPRCTGCHAADLSGGISAVSCFSVSFEGIACHPAGPAAFIHPEGWGAQAAHGPRAKAAPGAMEGLAWCQGCHGRDFGGGRVNSPCARCHGVPAPHPRAPWRGGLATHVTTDEGNADVCSGCHRRSGAGGDPGCFNNTLCHAARGVHPGGWGDAGKHGAAAKRAPAGSAGFQSCGECHGANFSGDGSGVSCFSCHGIKAPHPPAPWRGRLTHVTTEPRNASACIGCHRSRNPPPGVSPGCFNNTLCHPHEPGWAGPDLHGAGAKARPSATKGFPACQSCHGTLFGGGNPGRTCFRAGGCHTSPAPHAPGPWTGLRTHATTNTGNAGVCALCHRRPSAPASLPDNCFNTSLCHAQR
jgi:hypothetical protein